MTFTNAAARELEYRLGYREEPGNEMQRIGYCGTLHGFALRCLKRYGGSDGYGEGMSVINPEASEVLLESINRSVGNGKLTIKAILEEKARGRKEKPETPAEIVVAAYYREIRAAGIVDFDGLLTEFFRLLSDPDARSFRAAIAAEFDHLLGDEVQDSGNLDWGIFRLLPIANKFFVGDPDQSIYKFRGADVSEIVLAASDKTVEVIKLEDNFRSLSRITTAAQALIEHNENRVAKATISRRGVGGLFFAKVFESAGDELADVAGAIRLEIAGSRDPEEIAVLLRTNALAREFAVGLDEAGIPVAASQRVDLPPDFGRVRALVSYLCNPANDTLGYFFVVASLEASGVEPKAASAQAHVLRQNALLARKSINDFAYGFPRNVPADAAPAILKAHGATHESLMLVAEKLRDLPDGRGMLELAAALGGALDSPAERALVGKGVKVLTIHAAKGREFDTVFLPAFEDEAIPGRRKDCDVEEERRLAYVAMTRAKRQICASSSKRRPTEWQGVQPRTPIRFLKEAGK